MDLKTLASTAAAVANKVMEVAEVVAPLVPGGASILSVVKLVSTIGAGLVKSEPAAEALWRDIQAVKNGGAAPTAEQWADWKTRVDQAHDGLKAALAG
jgi:hypothetical protein